MCIKKYYKSILLLLIIVEGIYLLKKKRDFEMETQRLNKKISELIKRINYIKKHLILPDEKC